MTKNAAGDQKLGFFVEQMNDQFERVMEAFDSMNVNVKQIPGIHKKLRQVETDITNIKLSVGLLSEESSSFQEGMSSLKDNVLLLKKDMSLVKDDVSLLKEDMSLVKDDVWLLKDDVSLVKEDVSLLKKDTNFLKSQSEHILIDLDKIKSTISNHGTRIGDLERA